MLRSQQFSGRLLPQQDVLVKSGEETQVYRSWDPTRCPLAAGILSGLYHFPFKSGDIVTVCHCSCITITHLADIVGPTGQVRGIVGRNECTRAELEFIQTHYDNVWLSYDCNWGGWSEGSNTESQPILPMVFGEPIYLSGVERVLRAGCVQSRSPLHVLSTISASVISNVMEFMGVFPTSPLATTVLCFMPTDCSDISSESMLECEEYLRSSLESQVCSSKIRNITDSMRDASLGMVWVIMALRVRPGITSDEINICCERVVEVMSSDETIASNGGLRPKEQLLLDTTFMPNTVLLVTKYRRSSSTRTSSRQSPSGELIDTVDFNLPPASTPPIPPPSIEFDEDTLRAFASLLSAAVIPQPDPVNSVLVLSELVNDDEGEDQAHPPVTNEYMNIPPRKAAEKLLEAYSTNRIGGPMAKTLSSVARQMLKSPPETVYY
jgi:hypothetical protein